ncbi:MAG: ADP-ribosylglycohydrolase family protein [Anaerolineales bacterium]
MKLSLAYDRYLDAIWGGWIGKSIGGTVGARFEGYKGWIELDPRDLFPETIPPNDDLDLQILWLHVLEERGAALTSDDLAAAWLEHCWYPFNEYGIFRRNWQLGIHPPDSGRYGNAFWETGEGCPIRSEIWGYVFPGAPDLAAAYAQRDGQLDHTAQSVGAERMLAGMAAMAFFVSDLRRLLAMNLHYLPANTPIARLCQAAVAAYDEGLSLAASLERLLTLEGVPEACDSKINVPFTLLALLYGHGDLLETLLCALHCGYDTDCTLATAGALVGQILGAAHIPAALQEPIGDQLVMGIAYRRPEMTLHALARDTARIGALFTDQLNGACVLTDRPALAPLPQVEPAPTIAVRYHGLPCAAPGDTVAVDVQVSGAPAAPQTLTITPPPGWACLPNSGHISAAQPTVTCQLYLAPDVPSLAQANLFTARLGEQSYTFGVAGEGLYRFLGVYFEPLPPEGDALAARRRMNHHFVTWGKDYAAGADPDALFAHWSQVLGRPAVLAARENELDLTQMTGLRGACVAYFDRTVLSPDERDVYLVIGNTDAFRLRLNGIELAAVDERVAWSPFNTIVPAHLRAGANRLWLELVRRGDEMRFTLGIRQSGPRGRNGHDWCTELADANPLTG